MGEELKVAVQEIEVHLLHWVFYRSSDCILL